MTRYRVSLTVNGERRELEVDPRLLLVDMLRSELGLTALFVTHDMVEALLLGDRIAVLRDGRLVQMGTPEALLRAPADDYVAGLMETPRRQAAVVDRLLGEGSVA